MRLAYAPGRRCSLYGPQHAVPWEGDPWGARWTAKPVGWASWMSASLVLVLSGALCGGLVWGADLQSPAAISPAVQSPAGDSRAQGASSPRDLGLVRIQTAHFQMDTDLPASVAVERLRRAERVLTACTRYWERRLHGKVQVYYAKDMARWEGVELPERSAWRVLQRVGGGTKLEPTANGGGRGQAVIYCTSRPGVLEHEVVHAYCFQAFGHGGPAWYREGMAELIAQQIALPAGDQWHQATLDRLREVPVPALPELLQEKAALDELRKSVMRPLAETTAEQVALSVTPESWDERDARSLDRARTAYAQYWAFCYVMTHHRDLRDRFRLYGQQMLSGAPVRFEQFFAPVQEQIAFELGQFAARVQPGFRYEACQWQWTGTARELAPGQSKVVRIKAAAGFQDVGVRVQPGQQYELSADGRWCLSPQCSGVNADGNESGQGRLELVVLDGSQLSSSQQYGAQAEWLPDRSGKCYLRCFEDWAALGDNSGELQVRIARIR